MSTTVNPGDVLKAAQKEREAKAIKVKMGDTIKITDGDYAGKFLTVNADLVTAIEALWNPEFGVSEPIITREAACRQCTFTAGEGPYCDDKTALDFKVWNHEHVTGHRVDVRMEVDRV